MQAPSARAKAAREPVPLSSLALGIVGKLRPHDLFTSAAEWLIEALEGHLHPLLHR